MLLKRFFIRLTKYKDTIKNFNFYNKYNTLCIERFQMVFNLNTWKQFFNHYLTYCFRNSVKIILHLNKSNI